MPSISGLTTTNGNTARRGRSPGKPAQDACHCRCRRRARHEESERRSEASASSSSSFPSSWTRGAPEHAPWTPGATPPPAGRTPPSSAPPPSNRQTTARGGSGGRERRQLHLPRWECGSVDAVTRGICSSAATGQRDCRAAPPEVVSSVRVGLRARLAPPPPWLWRRCSVPVGRRAAATPPFSPSVQHCGGVQLRRSIERSRRSRRRQAAPEGCPLNSSIIGHAKNTEDNTNLSEPRWWFR